MAYQPYEFLFTDQNPNREFVVQPYTTNGPSSPDGGVDPSAANANTTLFLYGKGSPNYGERIQDNLLYLMEHFFSPVEPSFPIPGQVWCKSSSNELTSPFQLQMFNPRKYKVTASGGSNIYVQSDDGSETPTQVQARFQSLGLARQFAVYSSVYSQNLFIQTALPSISGPNVILTVTPTPSGSLVGQFIGGWEEIYQGNAQVVLRRSFDANNNNIINLATPVNPGDAANKQYVDLAVTGGTIALGDLSDVVYQNPGVPQTGTFLYFNGTDWTDFNIGSLYLPLSGGTMSGTINMGGFPITNVAQPTNAFDAANKQYVDAQPLSDVNVNVVAPATGDLLYFSSGGIWQNGSPVVAGVVPLTGGVTITGALAVNGGITSLPNPVNGPDAANKQYVDAVISGSGGQVVSGTYAANTGTLTLQLSGGFPDVVVAGFLPTPNLQVSDTQVVFAPENPTSAPARTATGFFANVMGNATTTGPNNIPDPLAIQLHAGLNQVDLALGNFTVPRQRFVFGADGIRQQFDINNGAGLSPVAPPRGVYVKGSNNLAVYINGIKQIASTSAKSKVTNFTVGGTYSATFTNTFAVVAGDQTRVFHRGVQFNVSLSLPTNNGDYIVTRSTFDGVNTNIEAMPNRYSSTPGTPFTPSGSGTITYTVDALTGDMETGYVYTGVASSAKTINVTVNSLSPVTVSIDPTLTNVSTLALLCDGINSQAASYYINSIVGISGLNFIVSGNVAAQFVTGTSFVIRYATNNGPGDTGSNYVVAAPGATYNSGTNQTSIPVAAIPNTVPADGVIFQDRWGFAVKIENGNLVFVSNLSGASSSIAVTDPGAGAGLLSSITGTTWPISISSSLGMSPVNAFAPQDYAYKEIGLYGSTSSLFYFGTAPAGGDTLEVLIDREMVYTSTNPLAAATIA